MSNDFQVNFSVSDFQAGASSFEVPVTPTSVISAYRLLVENVSGGVATLNIQFWKGDKVAGQETLTIDASNPPGNTLSVPSGVDKAVGTFGAISFPMGTVVVSVSSRDP